MKSKLLILLGVMGIQSIQAQLPTARLLTIFPPGARAGATTEVVVAGIDLDEASTVVFSHSNIVAQPKLNETTGLNEANKFSVVTGSNVPPAAYEARVVGRFGISNPRRFVVGATVEVVESANSSFATAMEVPLETVVNGRADAQAVDYFKFAAKKDQRLIAICEAQSIDSKMEPSLVLLDAKGRELQRSRRGGVLDFSPLADGQYVIKLHDFLFGGGAEYFYRLTVGALPYVDFLLPLAGNPGATNTFTLFGKNLASNTIDIAFPGSGAPTTLSANATALDGFEYPFGACNRRFISLTTSPVVREGTQAVQQITVPCDISGQFFPAGDTDIYAFDAKKGDVFWVEVISHRLGLPSDPLVVLKRAKDGSDVQEFTDLEANLGGAEFKTGSLDAGGRLEVKEDGEYQVHVRDLFNRIDNPANVYRLNIRKEHPDFELLAFAQRPMPAKKDVKDAIIWSAVARRGETVPIKVIALRERGYADAITLSVSGLPPGVNCPGASISPGQNSATLLLTASESASNWFGNLTINCRERPKIARIGTVIWNVDDLTKEAVKSRLSADLGFGVCGEESAPISIQPAEAQPISVVAGGKTKISVKVTRRGDFKETFKVKAYGVAALESLKEVEITDKTNVFSVELDLAQQKLSPGEYQFHFAGQTKGKYSVNPERAKKLEELAKGADTNQARKDALTALAKEAAERAKPKDVTITVYSAPILLKVAPVQTAKAGK